MVEVTKTKSGWVLEITNMVHGMLEQGGVCGRKILVKTATLSDYGIGYRDDPHVYMQCYDYVTPVQLLVHHEVCDRVLAKGEVIR